MHKIAVIGDRDSVYGFGALGLETHFATEPKDALEKIEKLDSEGCAIIYITEPLMSALSDELKAYEEKISPAIIPIPAVTGNTGIGKSAVRDRVIKAVGSDI